MNLLLYVYHTFVFTILLVPADFPMAFDGKNTRMQNCRGIIASINEGDARTGENVLSACLHQ